mmetsp:Transcript_26453/g.32616  ORF Transcript_26453/g.32616 Transcript_26453/m.32616 type:complete len:87 (-) Transcript_26453:246-506(-)
MLTKNRPKVESFSEELYCLPVGTTSAERAALFVPPADEPTNDDEILRHVAKTNQEKKGTVDGTHITGDYKTFLELIEKNTKTREEQ